MTPRKRKTSIPAIEPPAIDVDATFTDTDTDTDPENGRFLLPSPVKRRYARAFETAARRILEHVAAAMDVLDGMKAYAVASPAAFSEGKKDYLTQLAHFARSVDGMSRASSSAIHTAQGLRDDLPTARQRIDSRHQIAVAHIHYVPIATASDYAAMIERAQGLAQLPQGEQTGNVGGPDGQVGTP